MPNANNTTLCLVCGQRLVKNGKTAAGTQRWRCPCCGASSVRKRDDVTRRHQLTAFLTWLIGKHSQAEITKTATGRSLRRDTAWCWDIEPRLGPVETTHHQILIDGIWIGSWCLLIAVTETLQVLAWQWCARESSAAWTALLERIPAPTVVICDGGSGIAAAVRQVWPDTKTQRCLFHVQMNVRRYLTLNPRTDAGRRLLALSRELSAVRKPDDVIAWRLKLETWWQAHEHLTKEQSYDRFRWWFTHDRLRKTWHLLAKLSANGTLFTYVTYGNARTTSPLEGGINARLRHLLRAHRGMTEPHMKRAAEWSLTLHEIPIDRAHELIPNPPTISTTDHDTDAVELPEPSLYDTDLTTEEDLWTRSGWAGKA